MEDEAPSRPRTGVVSRRALMFAAAGLPFAALASWGADEASADTRPLTAPFDPPRSLTPGRHFQESHKGNDFPGYQVPVYAAGAGTVIGVGTAPDPTGAGGTMVVIRHDGLNLRTRYAHLEPQQPVRLNQQVAAGQLIGTMGFTGTVRPPGVAGAHLHYEVLLGLSGNRETTAVDPQLYTNFNIRPNPGSEPPPTPTPSIPEEDARMYVIRNNGTGHAYTVGKQFIRHEGNATNTETVVKVTAADDELIRLSPSQFAAVLDAFAIPRTRADMVLGGKFWSREQEILDELRGTGGRGVASTI